MNIPDTPFNDIEGEDFYPAGDDEAQRKILDWVNHAYVAAKLDKDAYQEKWTSFYKMYRSWVKARKKGDWRSHVFMPIAFYVIETITPRLVAQLPKLTVAGVGPEDAGGAEMMEELLDWATDKSDLYLELVKAIKSSLLYGTGILKTGYDEKTAYSISQEPEMTEQTAQIPMGILDMDGNQMTQTVSMGAQPTGKMMRVRRPYTSYAGPIAEAVDIDDFFVDPFADSIEAARYVIHRVYRDRSHLEKMFAEGTYKRPPDDVWQEFLSDHATKVRQGKIGLGSIVSPDRAQSLYSLGELWTDNVIVTVAGLESGATVLLRAERNPYAHGEKPFVRIVDHLVPHEFWGIGELEPLEGLQEAVNATWNTRIDNIKLVINTMLLANMEFIEDPSDLQVAPGKIVRTREGLPLSEVIQPLTLPDTTGHAYTEAAELERMSEKVSGVNPYMTGAESPAYNRTATGVALVSEQGNTRLTHKTRIAELTGFRRLARHYGAILQQYIPDQMVLRILGPQGEQDWKVITPDSIGGRFDYDIEAESSTQTESVRREQALSLFQAFAADPLVNPLKIRADLLKVFGHKDIQNYLPTPEQLMAAQQAQAQAALPAAPEEASAQTQGPPQQQS